MTNVMTNRGATARPDLRGRTILLYAPRFFGYDRRIEQRLSAWGAQVRHLPDTPTSFGFRARRMVGGSALDSFVRQFWRNQLRSVKQEPIDLVLIINGGVLGGEFVSELRASHPEARVVSYQWDSLSRSHRQSLVDASDRAFSFDRLDCEAQPRLTYLPLFYLPEYAVGEARQLDFDLLFVGTDHGDRYEIVRKVRRQFGSQGLSMETHLYKNAIGVARAVVASRGLIRPSEFTLSTLPAQAVLGLVLRSRAVLDIHNPNQSGLTMRTFEALAAGRKLVTTNSAVIHEPFYDPEWIHVIDRGDPVIDVGFVRGIPSTPIKERMAPHSLDRWLSSMLMEMTS